MQKSDINMTDRAAEHVRQFLAREPDASGLRLGVKPTGCSGYQYVVSIAGKTSESDRVFTSHGINIVVDGQSYPYLEGTEMDYVREGLNEGFRFHNPNVEQTCGCGESFSMKQDDAVQAG